MFLPELKLDILRRGRHGSFSDLTSRCIWTAEVHSDLGAAVQGPVQAGQVGLVLKTVAHGREEALEVGAAEVGATPQLGERVEVLADGVEIDVGGGVVIKTLCEVGVDAQELGAALVGCGGGGLGF